MTSNRIAFRLIVLLALGNSAAPSVAQTQPDLMHVDRYMEEDLRALMQRDKFAADPETAYPGLANQGISRRLDRAMNHSLEIMPTVAQEERSRAAVLDRVRGFLGAARSLNLPDAERDRIVWCYQRACAILGIDVAAETLSQWLNGTP
jgi:hypothetical protein